MECADSKMRVIYYEGTVLVRIYDVDRLTVTVLRECIYYIAPLSCNNPNPFALVIIFNYLFTIRVIIIISVQPKGRSLTANSGTKAAILPKGRSYIANSGT